VQESVLQFRGRRYLWLAVIVSMAAIAAYAWHDPQEPANGGTFLGYTLGTIGALLIVWLAYFGVRKRRYASTAGTVQGWLSAHVYLGVALLVVVLLHAGFQFGPNVHTLAFALMLMVIASGVYGVSLYLKLPAKISDNRRGASPEDLFLQLEELDARSRRVAADLDLTFQELVTSGIRRTQLGGSLRARLTGADQSQVVLQEDGRDRVVPNPGQEAALDWLAEQQSRCSDAERAAKIGELSALIRNKRQLLNRLTEDMRLKARLEVWLYAHVPLTAALLVALLVHIVSVFLYW